MPPRYSPLHDSFFYKQPQRCLTVAVPQAFCFIFITFTLIHITLSDMIFILHIICVQYGYKLVLPPQHPPFQIYTLLLFLLKPDRYINFVKTFCLILNPSATYTLLSVMVYIVLSLHYLIGVTLWGMALTPGSGSWLPVSSGFVNGTLWNPLTLQLRRMAFCRGTLSIPTSSEHKVNMHRFDTTIDLTDVFDKKLG